MKQMYKFVIIDVLCLVEQLFDTLHTLDNVIDFLSTSLTLHQDLINKRQITNISNMYDSYNKYSNKQSYAVTVLWTSICYVHYRMYCNKLRST